MEDQAQAAIVFSFQVTEGSAHFSRTLPLRISYMERDR